MKSIHWLLLEHEFFFPPLSREFYLVQSNTVIEYMWGFLGDAVVKNPPASAGDTRGMNLVPGSGRPPGEGNGNQLQYSCLDHPHGQRSLVGFSPEGHKESDRDWASGNTWRHTLKFLPLSPKFVTQFEIW